MIEVECNKCHQKNKVKFTSEIAGKKIMFKCKNSNCGEFISLTLPKRVVEEKITEILNFSTHSNTPEKAYLEFSKDNQTWRLPLKVGQQILGREGSNYTPDIVIQSNDRSISRKHCIIEGIEEKGNTWYIIQDNKSTNGTKLNGVILDEEDEIYLENNDEIEIGLTKLRFGTI